MTADPQAVGPAGVVLLARRATMNETMVRVMRVALEAGSGHREHLDRPSSHPLTGPGRGPLTQPVEWPGGVVPEGRTIATALRPSDMPEDLEIAA